MVDCHTTMIDLDGHIPLESNVICKKYGLKNRMVRGLLLCGQEHLAHRGRRRTQVHGACARHTELI
jgi:hypothetical protein